MLDKSDQQTKACHTGLLVAKLCIEHQNLTQAPTLTPEMKEELGYFLTALYLQEDAKLLWKQYLKIEDFTKGYEERQGNFTRSYVNYIVDLPKKQQCIKMSALNVAALLGNSFALSEMAHCGCTLRKEELSNASNIHYIIHHIKNIIDIMVFVPKEKIERGITAYK